VSSWLAVMHTYLCYFALSLSQRTKIDAVFAANLHRAEKFQQETKNTRIVCVTKSNTIALSTGYLFFQQERQGANEALNDYIRLAIQCKH